MRNPNSPFQKLGLLQERLGRGDKILKAVGSSSNPSTIKHREARQCPPYCFGWSTPVLIVLLILRRPHVMGPMTRCRFLWGTLGYRSFGKVICRGKLQTDTPKPPAPSGERSRALKLSKMSLSSPPDPQDPLGEDATGIRILDSPP